MKFRGSFKTTSTSEAEAIKSLIKISCCGMIWWQPGAGCNELVGRSQICRNPIDFLFSESIFLRTGDEDLLCGLRIGFRGAKAIPIPPLETA
jgi:hypothetical protein